MKKTIFSLILIYITVEYWAQYRFELNNRVIPFGMRNNMGVNYYDAFKLKPNFEGVSGIGINYKTDEFGFSINPNKKNKVNKEILIGGDSRAFGLFLNWKETLAGKLEAENVFVYQEAFPGNSPALFNYDLFEKGYFEKLKSKPKKVYYIYDSNDLYSDSSFMKQISVEYPWYSLRRLKLSLGGYSWSMLSLKVRSFLKKGEIKEVVIKKEGAKLDVNKKKSTASKSITHIHSLSLDQIKKNLDQQGVEFVLIHLPRSLEIFARNTSVKNDLEKWAATNSVKCLSLYDKMVSFHEEGIEFLKPYFIDIREGVHLSEKGSELLASWIIENERGVR